MRKLYRMEGEEGENCEDTEGKRQEDKNEDAPNVDQVWIPSFLSLWVWSIVI